MERSQNTKYTICACTNCVFVPKIWSIWNKYTNNCRTQIPVTIYLSLHNTNTNLHRSKFLILLYTNFDPTLLHTRNKIKFCSSYFEVNCKLFFVLITDMSDNNLLLLLILWQHVCSQRKPLLLHQDYQEEEETTKDILNKSSLTVIVVGIRKVLCKTLSCYANERIFFFFFDWEQQWKQQ